MKVEINNTSIKALENVREHLTSLQYDFPNKLSYDELIDMVCIGFIDWLKCFNKLPKEKKDLVMEWLEIIEEGVKK